MRLSLAEYLGYQKKLHEAVNLINKLEQEVFLKAMHYVKQGDTVEAKFLEKMSVDLQEGRFAHYLEPCQQEWMGGPTSGPGSEHTKTYINEPYFFPARRRKYTAAEVQEAKDLGLLQGGPDLTGPKGEEC